ncbi:MAG: S-layer homology domain-containing protein [Bacillota bacterium]|nr:S-layer homology domain-containing protein [Bacillota bacterium]
MSESGLLKKDGVNTRLNGQVWVTIPVNLEQINNPEKCAVFYQNDNGDWQSGGGVIDVASQTMQFRLNDSRPFMVVERDIRFEDTENRWSSEAIGVLTAKGIINGRSESQFDPTGNITRAEFTTLIVKSLFEGTLEYQNEFSDIAAGNWYASYIAKAVKLGLVSGMGNGQFAPDELITREQMIVILDKLNQLKADSANNNLTENIQSKGTQELLFAGLAFASDYAKESIIRMAAKYDVIIVGGGHNGLTAGCYLQKSGFNVLVLERMEKAGGGAWTEEATLPGFKHNLASLFHGILHMGPVYKDLELKKYGAEYLWPDA